MLLMLSACGSEPKKPDVAPQSTAVAAAPAAKASSAPAQSKTAVADAATGAAPVEVAVPPEAQQQFDSAVAAMAGNAAAAEQTFRALSENYPAYAGPLLNLAILQTKAGKLEDAGKTLSSAIARNSNSAAAYNQLGIVNRRMGRFKEADEAYQRALQIDPNYALAHLNLGVLCDLYLQQPQRALEAYERYLALSASPDAKVAAWVTELKTRLGSQQRSASAE
jgi:tetratricopeptide (TPR) repeat protein